MHAPGFSTLWRSLDAGMTWVGYDIEFAPLEREQYCHKSAFGRSHGGRLLRHLGAAAAV